MSAHGEVSAVAVVVPSHNEEALIGACLESVGIAIAEARAAGIRARAWVVLDACDDGSAAIAAQHDVTVVRVEARCVGIARAAGVRAAVRALRDVDASRLWLAHTDADSVVPPNWVLDHAALARRGADVVVGTVRPDFEDLTPAQTDAWLRTHTPGTANGHVHGANLGIRGSVYLAVGGFPPDAAHEDVRLVEAARETAARVVAADSACVRTSGRQVGRAPDGYARHLREDLVASTDGAGTR